MSLLMDKWLLSGFHLNKGLWVEKSTVSDMVMINVSASSFEKHRDHMHIRKDEIRPTIDLYSRFKFNRENRMKNFEGNISHQTVRGQF